MDTNQIKREGFSNPATEQFFATWPEERFSKDAETETACGFCRHKHFLPDGLWVLCLNPDSGYCFETLFATFSCPVMQPYD